MSDELKKLLEIAVGRLRAEWQATNAENTLEAAQAKLDALNAADVQPLPKDVTDKLLKRALQGQTTTDEEEFVYRLASAGEDNDRQALNCVLPLLTLEFNGDTYQLEANAEGDVLVVPVPPADVGFLMVGEQKFRLERHSNNALVQKCGYAELSDVIEAAQADGQSPRIELVTEE